MYSKDAVYYDLLNESLQVEDLAYYQKVIPPQTKSICELACGTGRIIFSLARNDRRLLGVDSSRDMLAIAQQKATCFPGQIDLCLEDMCHLTHHGYYDVLICGYNSMQHICDDSSLRSFFVGIRDNLSDQGLFLLDVFQPNKEFLFEGGNERQLTSFKSPDGESVQVVEQTKYYSAQRLNEIKYLYFKNGDFLFQEAYVMKQYDAVFLDSFICSCGFSILKKYGDYDMTRFTSHSAKQLYVLQVR